jgi:hypothetical protein
LKTLIKILALIPFIGLLGGTFFANRVTPYLFGMPFLLGYCVIWVALTCILMAIIYKIDPKNKEGEAQ